MADRHGKRRRNRTMKKRVAVLRGDGIGKEVTEAAVEVLKSIGRRFHHTFEWAEAPLGGEALDRFGHPFPEETKRICEKSDAILLGAVGGSKWDSFPDELQPEKGLLQIRKYFGLSVNIRPVVSYKSLLSSSPLKAEVAGNVNLVMIRELTGGIYFGQPSYHDDHLAVDTLQYGRDEIERVVRYAFQLAEARSGKVTSIDKANVLESSKLWRKVVNNVSKEHPGVALEHMLVDAAAMKLITSPSSFDVIVTENMFGDILSDEASVIAGSLGMLPSASLSADGFGMYEPVHGSAPDLAGKNVANPLAAILSAAMMLRHTFRMEEEACAVEKAVKAVLDDGYCTGEFQLFRHKVLTTSEMTAKVVGEIEREMVARDIMSAYA